MELISLKNVSKESKLKLIEELGFQSDEVFIFKSPGEKLLDKYTEEPIRVDNMLILPGKSPEVILDNNPLSISSYLEEYGDVL